MRPGICTFRKTATALACILFAGSAVTMLAQQGYIKQTQTHTHTHKHTPTQSEDFKERQVGPHNLNVKPEEIGSRARSNTITGPTTPASLMSKGTTTLAASAGGSRSTDIPSATNSPKDDKHTDVKPVSTPGTEPLLPLQYLRIAKTGSSTLSTAIAKMIEQQDSCKNVKVFFHNWTAERFPSRDRKFVVMREPCERFVSQAFHLKPRAKDGSKNLSKSYARSLKNPDKWADALLSSPSLVQAFLYQGHFPDSGHQLISWEQSVYIDNQTSVACLPTLLEDVEMILTRYAPGCKLPKMHDERYNSKSHKYQKDAGLCNKVKQIYTTDFELYDRYCGEAEARAGHD